MRYYDPDGRKIVQDGTNADKVASTQAALNKILGSGKYGTVVVSTKRGNTYFSVTQNKNQQKAAIKGGDNSRAARDLVAAAASADKAYVIHNVDSKARNLDKEEAKRDAGLREKYTKPRGGAAVVWEKDDKKKVDGATVIGHVFIDFSGLDPVKGNDGSTIDEPGWIALGHELLGHLAPGNKGNDDEDRARRYENKYLRNPAGEPLRELEFDKH